MSDDLISALRALAERVEIGKAKGSDFMFAPLIHANAETEHFAHRAYCGSLDYARTLHETVLPGWRVFQIRQMRDWAVRLERSTATKPDHLMVEGTDASDPARAWLLAILRAIIAETKQ